MTPVVGIFLLMTVSCMKNDRGELGTYENKFIWTESGEAFVPNYFMIDVMANRRDKGTDNDLSLITEKNFDSFLTEFLGGHGFNGVHVPVYGQWFHIGENRVSRSDSAIDQRTFDKLRMIINKTYSAGGCTHIWLWGDDSRSWTSASLAGGIMGEQEKHLLDEIHRQLGPINGWTMGYGFDLWEWVGREELKEWHDYLWAKPGWKHLLGARGTHKTIGQIYEGLDYAGYEYHKPWYKELIAMINARHGKPSFSEDRYRIRHPSKYPEKDYNEEETRRGLWHHTMAGGVAAIWGKLDGDGTYSNREALKCFSVFWNDHKRFTRGMTPDNSRTDGYCLRDGDKLYVFYRENAGRLKYGFDGKRKNVVAVDTRKKYREISIGRKEAGDHMFIAPYVSDWAVAVE